MRKAMIATAVGAAMATAACSTSRGEDAGPAVSRNFQVDTFEKIEVAGPYDLEVRAGPQTKVSASGPEAMLEGMEVEVRGGVLHIKPSRNGSWFGFGERHAGKVTINVTVPTLSGASLAGSGDMRIDRVQGPAFSGEIAGSGALAIAQVEVGELEIAIAGAGDVKAGAGNARVIRYDIAGSGDIDSRNVKGEQLAVSIAGSGNVVAQATGTAKVDIMGSGDVEIAGGAKCSVSKMGSGNVRCV